MWTLAGESDMSFSTSGCLAPLNTSRQLGKITIHSCPIMDSWMTVPRGTAHFDDLVYLACSVGEQLSEDHCAVRVCVRCSVLSVLYCSTQDVTRSADPAGCHSSSL